MSRPGLEIELKLTLLAPVTWTQIIAALAEAPIQAPTIKRLANTYYDTPDGRLSQRRMALRVRQSGASFTQTLKLGGDASALQQRGEWEWALDGPEPDLAHLADPEFRERIGILFGDALQPIYTTQFERHATLVSWPPGRVARSQIELALDQGRVVAGARQAPIAEIELELKAGSTHHLFDLASRLGRMLPLRPGSGSKAATGERLRRGRSPEPVRAAPPELDPAMPVVEALPVMLGEACAQWIGNLEAASEGSDPEGVHQLRVALRRLRSLLGMFRPWLQPEAARQWQRVLREHLQLAGPARMLDVFIADTLDPLARAMPEDAAITAVAEAAAQQRDKRYDSLRKALREPANGAQMLDFLCWLEQREWLATGGDAGGGDTGSMTAPPERLDEAAGRILARRYRKLRKMGKGFTDMPMPQRHELRLCLKQLRYAVDFLGPLFADSQAFRQKLARLQDELGVANDLAESRQVIAELRAGARGRDRQLAMARVAGLIDGWGIERLARQEARTSKAWRALKRAPRFWETDR